MSKNFLSKNWYSSVHDQESMARTYFSRCPWPSDYEITSRDYEATAGLMASLAK